MGSFIQFFVIVAAITTVYGQIFNVTSSAQDYLLLSQRELLHEIEIAELQIDAVDTRFADRLDVIQYDQQQSLNLIQKVNQTLMPLQALSLVRKHCIQKYDSQFISYDSAKLRFDVCYNKAQTSGDTLTVSAKSYSNHARSYATITLPKTAADCNKYTNQTLLEQCYVKTVESSTTNIHNYLKTSGDQLEKSLYDANVITRTAVQCSFQVEKDVLDNLTVTTKAIDDCETDMNKKKTAVAVQSDSEERSVHNLIMGKVKGE